MQDSQEFQEINEQILENQDIPQQNQESGQTIEEAIIFQEEKLMDGSSAPQQEKFFDKQFKRLNISMRSYEVSSQYFGRKKIYQNVYNKLQNHDKAVCYSNIWYNMKYLGARYSQQIEDTVKSYEDKLENQQ